MLQPKIAVLDTGIDWSQLTVNKNNISSVLVSEKAQSPGQHAALVINILGTVCPNALIQHVGIMGPNGNATGLDLYRGLKWCTEQDDIDVICLSLCYRNQEPIPEIEALLAQLHEQGVVIIASRHNDFPGESAYPADCETTIGVDQLNGLKLGNYEVLDSEHKILGMNGHGIITKLGKQTVSINGNSFSAPILAARIANSRLKGKCDNLVEAWHSLAS
ncbi:S8 family serine peptidase [Pseudoalteromonas rubra]|uniref:S8 family serine peptidase n=1 Tax=Pseudoalteromonas rubra TaxID=43658 RepID=UPI000F772D9E|nr:S8 family serine peptidase [Pseudoalteromonas rubra]